LRERIGKTHGMTLRMSPPRNAKRRISGSREVEVEVEFKAMEMVRARCPEVSQGFSATSSPERLSRSLAFGLSGTFMIS